MRLGLYLQSSQGMYFSSRIVHVKADLLISEGIWHRTYIIFVFRRIYMKSEESGRAWGVDVAPECVRNLFPMVRQNHNRLLNTKILFNMPS